MGQLMDSKTDSEEAWIKVLGKGMITLPKKWRDAMGIEQGDVVKAKKEGDKVVLEASAQKGASIAPYRVYRVNEINEFLEEDRVSEELTKQAEKKIFPPV
jgi:AbrB family looped-hinge helix DNA binding protein